MGLILESLSATWLMLVQAAPYILFGLLMAGLIHVLLPESLVLRWMGHQGLSGVVRAALIGVPLPVCSCGVVPITVELRRKGASRPAAQSFLITTPESSIDSIFLTWGMMGPLMAIARPIAAFFTAVLGGVLSIASAKTVAELSAAPLAPGSEPCAHDHGHHHPHGHHHAVAFSGSDKARQALRDTFAAREPDDEGRARPWTDLIRPALHYGFVELLDDLAFWLLIGLGLAGTLTAALPDDLGTLGLGAGIVPMILLLAVGVPMYMCASASTPIAAALLAKGVSPGAALVFLLAGPATNAATILLLAATFGRRFVQIYVASVVLGALAAGLLLDALVGSSAAVSGLHAGDEWAPGAWSILMALVLLVLLARSLWRGAWVSGVAELRQAQQRLRDALSGFGRLSRRGMVAGALIVVTVIYLLSGLRVVPADARGYAFLFDALDRSDLEPGLHYVLPAPFGGWELRRVDYPRKSDVGFRTDLDQLQSRRELMRFGSRNDWHSPVAAMNANPVQAAYLTADENLIELSFSVHYFLSDSVAFFYGVDHSEDFVNLYAESVARELVATALLDDLLTARRREIESRIQTSLQRLLDAALLGIEVSTVRIVDIHPPGAAVSAFRDVSSALEDRETQIHRAHELVAQAIPRARGRGTKIVAAAEAQAVRSSQRAAGRSASFLARAQPFARQRDLLGHLLWIETAERVLAGREIYIVPPDTPAAGVTLWRRPGAPFFPFPEED